MTNVLDEMSIATGAVLLSMIAPYTYVIAKDHDDIFGIMLAQIVLYFVFRGLLIQIGV